MEETLRVANLAALQWLVDMDVMGVDTSYHIGLVKFPDGTEMTVQLYGTEVDTVIQGVILGLGNDEIRDTLDTLDVEGYRVTLI